MPAGPHSAASSTFVNGKCVVVPRREPAARKAAAPARRIFPRRGFRQLGPLGFPSDESVLVNDASKVSADNPTITPSNATKNERPAARTTARMRAFPALALFSFA